MTDKLPAMESLLFIREKLLPQLGLVSLDKPTRTHCQAFAIKAKEEKQFLLIVGTEENRSKQTRIITEKIINPPNIKGVRFSNELAKSHRVNQLKTSLGHENHLKDGNQSSFFVSNLNALEELIRWYAEFGLKAEQTVEIPSAPNCNDNPVGPSLPLPEDFEETQDIIDILSENSKNPTTIKQLIDARLGQGKFREDVIKTWGLGKRCAVTGIEIPQILIASHIIPWREAEELRLDGRNGIILCSHLDKLFDNYLITFDSIGQLVPSKRLSSSDWHYLEDIGIHESLKLNMSALEDIDITCVKENLKKHQQHLLKLDHLAMDEV